MFFAASLLLITPGILTDMMGLIGGLLVLGSQVVRGRRYGTMPQPAPFSETDQVLDGENTLS